MSTCMFYFSSRSQRDWQGFDRALGQQTKMRCWCVFNLLKYILFIGDLRLGALSIALGTVYIQFGMRLLQFSGWFKTVTRPGKLSMHKMPWIIQTCLLSNHPPSSYENDNRLNNVKLVVKINAEHRESVLILENDNWHPIWLSVVDPVLSCSYCWEDK